MKRATADTKTGREQCASWHRAAERCGALLIWALTGCLLLCAALALIQRAQGAVLPTIFGYGEALVTSGSMTPTICTGDMVLIREQPATNYAVGDVVLYWDGSALVTHRVVSAQEDTLVTCGDANTANDRPIARTQVVGRVVRVLPWAGRVVQMLRKPSILLLLVTLAGCILVSPRLMRRRAAR